MSAGAQDAPRTYGGWRKVELGGLGRFSLGQSFAGMAALAVMVVLVMLGQLPIAGAVMLLVVVLGALGLVRDRHGMNLFDRRKETRMFNRARRRGATIRRAGALGLGAARGRLGMPGVLGAARLTEHEDSLRRRFALIHQGDGRMTVVMALAPVGERLADPPYVDELVARWSQWLAELSRMHAVADSTLTVETSPDSGAGLAAMVDSSRGRGSDLSHSIIEEAARAMGPSGAVLRVWATVSYSPSRLSRERRGRERRAVEAISTQLPDLTQKLMASGAGEVRVLDAAALVRLARVAYDPGAEAVFEAAALAGEAVDLSWGEAGPAGMEARWSCLAHDSGLSRSWTMTGGPKGLVQSSVLRELLGVSSSIPRKRVTIMYRPMDPAQAAEVVESDLRKSNGALRMAGEQPPIDKVEAVRKAEAVRNEEAQGASLLDFGMVCTITVPVDGGMEALEDASVAMESLGGGAHLTLRPAWGAQDSAFAIGLPLGVAPDQQSLGQASLGSVQGVW